MFDNLQNNIPYMAQIAEGFSVIAGVTLILFGFFGIKRFAQMRGMMGQEQSLAKPLMLLVGGSALLALPTLIPAFVTTVFASSVDANYDSTGMLSSVGLVMFIRFLGLCSIIKGIIMLAKAGGHNVQPGVRGKALIHMFCGILLLHIMTVKSILVNTFS